MAPLLAGLGVCGILAAGQVCAQAGTANTTPDADAAGTAQLQEVVVTAERRTADLQRTPVAVSVRQGSDLLQQGKFSTQQILEDVPSVSQVPPSGGGLNNNDSPANAIAIRGIQTNGSVPGSYASVVPATAYYADGVLNGIGGTYDLSEVQVLRGPQGTLYGRSATAGAVLVTTANPTLGKFGGNASVEVGNYSLQHYSAAINLPATDTLALRIAGNHYERAGYYAPEGGRVRTDDGRAKLLFKPNADFSLLLGFALQNNQERNGERTAHITGPATDGVTYDLTAPLGTGYDQTRQYWLQMDWNLGPATLTYIPALRDYQQHGTSQSKPNPVVLATTYLYIPTDLYHTQELRLASNSTAPWQWQTGVFYYNNHSTVWENTVLSAPFLPGPTLIFSSYPENRYTQNVGVFAESTYSFPTNTRMTTGIRGDYTKVATQQTTCQGPYTFPLYCPDFLPSSQGTRIWHNFTYKLRAEQDLTPTSLVYASVSSAFLPGDVAIEPGVTIGVNFPPTIAPYEPETLIAGELGSKNRFLDNRLQLNGDVFYYRYGGKQNSVYTYQIPVPGGGGPFLATTMDSPARMVGAELEVLFQATPSDRLGLSMSYIDAYYVDKPALFAGGVANTHFAGVVPWQINPTYQHVFALPHDQALTFNAEALYRSRYLVTDYGPAAVSGADPSPLFPYLYNGATVRGDFSLTYNFLPQASLSAYVRNVSDARYKASVGVVSLNPVQNSATLSEPRTFGAVLSARF